MAATELHTVLASPILRRRLTAIVARRVPSDHAEDVVQSVLCDALAAQAPTGEAIPRWLFGIARNKVADWHRRARREEFGEVDVAVETDSLEARDMLRVACAIAPDRRALEWIARAEGGEAFEEIARDQNISTPALRQRVSRLRRALRAALLVAATLAIFVLVHSGERIDRIGPEPGSGASLDGTWHVASIDCPQTSAACTAARHATVTVRGNVANVRIGGGTLTIAIDEIEREHHARLVRDGAVVRIESDLGTVVLAR